MNNFITTCQPMDETVRKNYNEKFDAEFYLNHYFKEVFPTEKICLDRLYQLFNEGKLEGSINRGLDAGCGPVVHRLSPVSLLCETLYYAEFSEINRKVVEEWLARKGPDSKYENVFKYCAQKEGFEDLRKGVQDIETRIKSKVRGVIPINFVLDQPIGAVDQPFDVIFTGACLEAAVDSYEGYDKAIKGLADILRSGGYLIIRGYAGGDFYFVGDVKYPNLKLNVNMVTKALNEVGYVVLEAIDDAIPEEYYNKMHANIGNALVTNCTGCFFVLAKKI